MTSLRHAFLIVALFLSTALCHQAGGAKLVDVRPVDEQHLMLRFLDGEVDYKDDGEGPTAFKGHESGQDAVVVRHGEPLNATKAAASDSYTISSGNDPNYSKSLQPASVNRKSKVDGIDRKWPEANYVLEHTIFLELPHKLVNGSKYSLTIAPATNSDRKKNEFQFDVFKSVTEAIHVNIIGYNPDITAVKSADLYMWMGDGGARDYSDYEGRKVMLYNVDTGASHDVGKVSPGTATGKDLQGRDVLKSKVWNCDFSAFTGTGRFRLAIDGIGASPDFEIRKDIYYEPFKTSVRGFFYMRIGMDKNFNPPPRQPRFIPDVDPPGFKVYRTTMEPGHPDWKKHGWAWWDRKDEWIAYREPGEPTNPDAWGGHSDALDWDRRSQISSISWDLMLPYLLSNGKIGEDNLDIAESGNGIPDIIDEALYELDYWRRLRDAKGGYSFGLNNPSSGHQHMHQAAARPYMAWKSAASCAMAADCMRIAGKPDLVKKYVDAALEAWKVANEEDLDFTWNTGNGEIRGRDLKMMAAAHLYNITGDRMYEDIVAAESVVTGPTSELDRKPYCQYWGTAAYLLCAKNQWQPIHYPKLVDNMKASILNEAIKKNVTPSTIRPSRRSTDEAYGYFQGTIMVQPLCIAHAVLDENDDQRDALLQAMLLEADYSQGRNPMNMVFMTGLGSRCVEEIYTSGRDDGVPGLHPGHTPYMNTGNWGQGYGADPMWYANKGYPAWVNWPFGEALWNVRYCYANNEFTSQQTMRGKMVLLGYLYSLGEPGQH
jgi:hypothetical protein